MVRRFFDVIGMALLVCEPDKIWTIQNFVSELPETNKVKITHIKRVPSDYTVGPKTSFAQHFSLIVYFSIDMRAAILVCT